MGEENESFQCPDEGCTQNNASLEINPLSTLSEAHLRTTAYKLLKCGLGFLWESVNVCCAGAV